MAYAKRLQIKYRVLIEGNNFAIKMGGKVVKHGFFTTRFIEAGDSKSAEMLALNMVRNELKSTVLNLISDPPLISVEETYEIEDFGNHLVPGSGFTWFEEKGTGE